jgi:hypothetical protein
MCNMRFTYFLHNKIPDLNLFKCGMIKNSKLNDLTFNYLALFYVHNLK